MFLGEIQNIDFKLSYGFYFCCHVRYENFAKKNTRNQIDKGRKHWFSMQEVECCLLFSKCEIFDSNGVLLKFILSERDEKL